MYTKKLILVLAGLAILVSVPFALSAQAVDAQDPAEAYMALVRGDGARGDENWAEALAAYEDAIVRYKRIADLHPDWEADIVQYRIGYCEKQIRELALKPLSDDPVEAGEVAAVSAAPVVIAAMQGATDAALDAEDILSQDASAETEARVESVYKERYLASMHENEYLRQRIEEVMDEEVDPEVVEDLRSANDELRAQLARTMGQSQGVEERIRNLEAQNYQLAVALAEQEQAEEGSVGFPFAGQEREALTRERMYDYEGALVVYKKILSDYPDTDSACKGRARCLVGLGRTSEAIAELRQVIAVDPADSEARLLLGVACASTAKYSEAVGLIQPLVEGDPWNAYAHGVLGAALLGRGDRAAAQTELEKAIMLDPQLADAHFNLAVLLAEGNAASLEKAREHYRLTLTLGATPDAALDEILGTQ